jgi:DNA primase
MAWLDDLVDFSASQLDDTSREALWSRGVTDQQIQLYRIGYLNRQLPQLQGAEVKAFMEWSHGGSKLDGVFVLPLTNALGEIRGLQFRHVERSRSGYMDYILDQGEPVLFGLAQALPCIWRTGAAFLVEGAFDLFPIQRTMSGVVATLTARVPDTFLRFLRRLVQDIWLGWDNDSTGRTSCGKFLSRFGSEFAIHPVVYPQVPKIEGGVTKDPGELWESWGEAKFSKYVRSLVRADHGME